MRRPVLAAAAVLAFAASCGPRAGSHTSSNSTPTGPISVEWAVPLSASEYATASDLAIGPGDVVAVTGGYAGALKVGAQSLPAAADQDGFVALLGADGVPLWLRAARGPAFDHLRAVSVSADGRVAVAGVASHGAELAGSPLPASFVAMLSPAGTPQWVLAIESSEQSAIADLAFTPGGDLLAVGYGAGTLRVGSHTVTSAGSLDAIMLRIDRRGTPLWLRRAGGKAADFAHAVTARGDEIAVVGGFARSAEFGSATLRSNHNEDGYLAMLAGDGQLLWVNTFGGSARDSALTVVADDTQVVVGGVFASDDANFGTGRLIADDTGTDAAGFIAAFGAKGQPRWAVRLGDGQSDSVALALAGPQVWVGGSYSGAQVMDSVDLEARGKRDLAVLGLGPQGAAVSGISAGGPEQDDLVGLGASSSGDIVMVGNFTSSLQLAGHSLRTKATSKHAAFVARISQR